MVYGLVPRDVGISPNEVEDMYEDHLEDVLESWEIAPPAFISAAVQAGTYKPETTRRPSAENLASLAAKFGGKVVKRGG